MPRGFVFITDSLFAIRCFSDICPACSVLLRPLLTKLIENRGRESEAHPAFTGQSPENGKMGFF
jgi:hypothetical protein